MGAVTWRALSWGPTTTEDMPARSLPLSFALYSNDEQQQFAGGQEGTETGINWRGECHRLTVEFQRSVEADPLLWVLVFQLLYTLSCCIHPPTHIVYCVAVGA